MNRSSNEARLISWGLLFLTAWVSRDLLQTWRVDPNARWTVPCLLMWGCGLSWQRWSERPVKVSQTWLYLGLFLLGLGAFASVATLQHLALACSLLAWAGRSFRSGGWSLVAAFSWFPTLSWVAVTKMGWESEWYRFAFLSLAGVPFLLRQVRHLRWRPEPCPL